MKSAMLIGKIKKRKEWKVSGRIVFDKNQKGALYSPQLTIDSFA